MDEPWMTKHEQELTAVDVRRMRELATEHVRRCMPVAGADARVDEGGEAL